MLVLNTTPNFDPDRKKNTKKLNKNVDSLIFLEQKYGKVFIKANLNRIQLWNLENFIKRF